MTVSVGLNNVLNLFESALFGGVPTSMGCSCLSYVIANP